MEVIEYATKLKEQQNEFNKQLERYEQQIKELTEKNKVLMNRTALQTTKIQELQEDKDLLSKTLNHIIDNS